MQLKHTSDKIGAKIWRLSDRLVTGRIRFILPIAIVLLGKIIGFVWLYYRMIYAFGVYAEDWTEYFWGASGWDSVHYVAIARSWYTYPSPKWAFFPAYPILIRAFYFVFNDYETSALFISNALGIFCLPLFQRVGEEYMPRREALACTILMSLFPFTFVFMTVAYSESLFLLATLATWYLYLKDKVLLANLCAGVAALSRQPGIFIAFPMFLDLLIHRRWRKLPLCFIASIFLLGWLYYSYLLTGDWFAFRTVGTLQAASWLRDFLVPLLTFSPGFIFPPAYMTSIIAYVIVVGLLTFYSYRTDWRLGVYSAFTYIALLAYGYVPSLPRFFSFIFPVWLSVRLKNPAAILITAVFFYLHALVQWAFFIEGRFVV